MGFNVGVLPKDWNSLWEVTHECDQFIERTFYNFVNSIEMYGDNSILIKSGNYYGLDLSPLSKLVYTWDDISEEDATANLQSLDFLLTLTDTFREKITNDTSVCKKIKYQAYDESNNYSEEVVQTMIQGLGPYMGEMFLQQVEEQKRREKEEPNPWDYYFETGQILGDLNALIGTLQCIKSKGVEEVFLTAG